jgi:hypothetical protein
MQRSSGIRKSEELSGDSDIGIEKQQPNLKPKWL